MFALSEILIFVVILVGVMFWLATARQHNRNGSPRMRGRGGAHHDPWRQHRSESVWTCARPNCLAENPGHALYCRMCGSPRR
jgi:hypothetical protein